MIKDFSYSDEQRKEVLEMAENPKNNLIGVPLSLAYHMYDIMRVQTEELHLLRKEMESIHEIIQNREHEIR
jgi:hypothetical protein